MQRIAACMHNRKKIRAQPLESQQSW